MKKTVRAVAIYIFAALLAVFCLFTTVASSFVAVSVRADDTTGETEYSDVLEDLQNDSSFNAADYPQDDGDYSLDIITLAESSDDELFVYVYQPSGSAMDFRASSINISRETGDDLRYYNYKLQYLNSSGVFYKYLVRDFTVLSGEAVRYYSITSIYRPFDDSIDEQANYDNTVTEVNYDISRQYAISTNADGSQVIEMVEIETITITDKFVGFVRYMDGYIPSLGLYGDTACDSHFVAFSTDRDMDKLLEADVYYTSQTYSLVETMTGSGNLSTSELFGDIEENYAYLTYDEEVTHEGRGWFAATYTWNRIETVEQFIDETVTEQEVYTGIILGVSVENTITDEGLAALESQQWVLRFTETAYESSVAVVPPTYYMRTITKTMVGDVTILRLKFKTNGVVYNLGVVDNKQTGSDQPINEETWSIGLAKKVNWLTIVTLILVGIGGIIVTRIIKKYTK